MSICKISFRIQCPFDSFGTIPPQESEILCIVHPGEKPVFGPPNVCDRCNGTNLGECKMCVKALYLMFQLGKVPMDFDFTRSFYQIHTPLRPSLALLSERSQPAGQ